MKTNTSGLTAGQLMMMALGAVIGGSFFLGSAIVIRNAGPSALLAYIWGGFLSYLILYALSELTVADPAPGSFRAYAVKTFGRGAGFVVGWVYWTGMVLVMSAEATAAALLIRAWIPEISLPLMGCVIIVVVTFANLLGADRLSKLESSLATVKVLALTGFIVIALALIFGILTGKPPLNVLKTVREEAFMPGGIRGITGSMLLAMSAFTGFEIIGLAASETSNPHHTVPLAITRTILVLVILYTLTIGLLLLLIPTSRVTENISPIVTALTTNGLGWTAAAMNIVLVTAILSTMLAAMFGLARMLQSLADEGHAPAWMKESGKIPYRCILSSGGAMLLGLAMSFFLPKKIYIFLVSAGSFSLLFTYFVILAAHYKIRRKNGCPPKGECQLPGFPYTSWIAILSLVAILAGMPLIPGQGSGLVAGLSLVAFFTLCYLVLERRRKLREKA